MLSALWDCLSSCSSTKLKRAMSGWVVQNSPMSTFLLFSAAAIAALQGASFTHVTLVMSMP